MASLDPAGRDRMGWMHERPEASDFGIKPGGLARPPPLSDSPRAGSSFPHAFLPKHPDVLRRVLRRMPSPGGNRAGSRSLAAGRHGTTFRRFHPTADPEGTGGYAGLSGPSPGGRGGPSAGLPPDPGRTADLSSDPLPAGSGGGCAGVCAFPGTLRIMPSGRRAKAGGWAGLRAARSDPGG